MEICAKRLSRNTEKIDFFKLTYKFKNKHDNNNKFR